MVRSSFEPHGLKKVEVNFPLDSPEDTPPYRAITELYFDDAATIGACMRAAGKRVMMDVQNYTNSQPMSFVSLVHSFN